ncbi:MAG: hypothetical protein M0Z56_09990 [Desulfobacteraceae bacterium]|nr:hypothetical protein [Desulfobacteraceae bacterium]
MKKVFSYVMVMFVVGLALHGVTRNAEAFQKEHKELILSGNGTSDARFDGTIFAASGSLGYFLTDNFEALIRQDISYSKTSGSSGLWNGGTRFGIDYHFNIAALYPFVGANVGYLYGDTLEEQFVAGPQTGVKFFANSTTFILGMVEYEFFFKSTSKAGDNFDNGRFVYNIGIGFIW